MKPLDRSALVLLGLILANVGLAYFNYFRNSFHLDDAYTIEQNPAIRRLANIPRFFTDASTFSKEAPAGKEPPVTYRPVVSTSFAIDYYLAGGLREDRFHTTTLFCYLAYLVVLFMLFRAVVDRALPDPQDPRLLLAPLFATALYGLHPVMAETLNYVTRRADLYATLGVAAGIAMYAWSPQKRHLGLYLLPVVLATLAHPSALVFPALLFAYDFLCEQAPGDRRLGRSLVRSIPAWLACAAMGALLARMTPRWFASSIPAHAYLITQPYVALRYFLAFFLPVRLSAESDLTALRGPFEPYALLGFAFLAALLLAAWRASSKSEWRPAAFGLWWFFLALLPTAVLPNSRLEAGYRMFFPFVGLALAASWAAALLLYRLSPTGLLPPNLRPALAPAGVVLLLALTFATRARNEVWHDEETLWYDVATVSPHNGRALMNYGLIQLAKGRYDTAVTYLESALPYHPDPHLVEINLGFAAGNLHHDDAAETHFRRAIDLSPADPQSDYYYARWLHEHGRNFESLAYANVAMAIQPRYLDPRYLALEIYSQTGDPQKLISLASDTLKISPGDSKVIGYLQQAPAMPSAPPAPASKTADAYVTLSLDLYRAGRFQDCIDAARHALALNPNYAAAYNNIAAGYQSMHRWDQAIQAAEQALRLQPDFPLARNNLLWSRAQKEKEQKNAKAARP